MFNASEQISAIELINNLNRILDGTLSVDGYVSLFDGLPPTKEQIRLKISQLKRELKILQSNY